MRVRSRQSERALIRIEWIRQAQNVEIPHAISPNVLTNTLRKTDDLDPIGARAKGANKMQMCAFRYSCAAERSGPDQGIQRLYAG